LRVFANNAAESSLTVSAGSQIARRLEYFRRGRKKAWSRWKLVTAYSSAGLLFFAVAGCQVTKSASANAGNTSSLELASALGVEEFPVGMPRIGVERRLDHANYQYHFDPSTRTFHAMKGSSDSRYGGLVVDSRFSFLKIALDARDRVKAARVVEGSSQGTTEMMLNLYDWNHGQRVIDTKLDKIHISRVRYDAVSLGDVLTNLRELSIQNDPEKRGVNFIISPDLKFPANSVRTNFRSEVRVSLRRELTDLRLHDLVDAVVKCADRPITYSVENYAVVFSPKY
jgi:hypothetical protein